MGIALFVAALVVLFALTVLATSAHAAIARIDRVKAHVLAQDERKGSAELLRIVEAPALPASVTYVIAGLAHVSAAALAAGWAVDRWDVGGEAVIAVLVTATLFLVAEMAARSVAVLRTESTALWSAPILLRLTTIFGPIGRVMIFLANLLLRPFRMTRLPKGPFATDEELRAIVDPTAEIEDDEEDEEDERELIHSVFEFGDAIVREVMVPRLDMITMRSDASLEEALKVIVDAGYSRIPIYDGEIDNIVGVLYAKDLMRRMHESDRPIKTVGSLGRAPTFVPETKRLNELLREMQDQHVHMAIVVDEYGGTAGLVTIEDLIEEIVGEIVDEFDREEPLVEPIDGASMRVDAKMPIDEVNELLGSELPDDEWDTVGGLVFGLTGRVPTVGETVRFDGLLFTTERVTGRRIQKVVIRRTGSES